MRSRSGRYDEALGRCRPALRGGREPEVPATVRKDGTVAFLETRHLIILLSLVLLAGPAGAAETGTVRGKVTVTGQKSNRDAVISIEAEGLKTTPPPGPVKIDQKGFRFIPHITLAVPGTVIRFLNNDPEPHNVYSPEGRYNLGTWPTGETRDHRFDEPGIYTQLCNIHPDMLAYVVVLPTPYFAVTGEDGTFEVKGVPPGQYLLWAWHEKKDGLEKGIVVKAGEVLNLDLVIER